MDALSWSGKTATEVERSPSSTRLVAAAKRLKQSGAKRKVLHRAFHSYTIKQDRLSNIINQFNDLFGDIEWEDEDRVHKLITETIPARVAEDKAYRNAQQNSDRENAKIEHERALGQVMISVLNDDTTLYRHFVQNPGFKRWLTDLDFELSSERVEGRAG